MNLNSLFDKLQGLSLCGWTEEFEDTVLGLNEEPSLEPDGTGFRLKFPNGFYIKLYETHGVFFSTLKDENSTNSSQVFNQKKACGVFNEVLEYLTAPA